MNQLSSSAFQIVSSNAKPLVHAASRAFEKLDSKEVLAVFAIGAGGIIVLKCIETGTGVHVKYNDFEMDIGKTVNS